MPTLLMITPENLEINQFRVYQLNNFTQLTMPYLAGVVPEEYNIRLLDEWQNEGCLCAEPSTTQQIAGECVL